LYPHLQIASFFLGVLGSTRLPVHKALAFRAFKKVFGAFCVIDAKRATVIPLKRDFVDVALEVVFAYRVMRSVHLALDDRMEADEEQTRSVVSFLATKYEVSEEAMNIRLLGLGIPTRS